MSIGVLGPVTVNGDSGTLAPRERVVLAALAARHGEVVGAGSLADALWGEGAPVSWAKVVQGCVVRLRKQLGADAIQTRGQGYCLVVAAEDIDAFRFERSFSRAQELLSLGEPDRAVYAIDEALGLWRGRALADLDRWDQGRIEGERLDEMRLDAEELHLDAALQAGRYRAVLAEAQARVAEAPLREHRWTLLALAQYQAGRQGDALRTLHRARAVLVQELGLDPGPDIVALEEAILRHDPSLVAAHLPQTSPTCPYLGLVPYGIGDSDAFFGRETEVSDCVHRLEEESVLVVVGPSGSGKSSLVRAGVAASLQRSGRRVVVITPGAHPMDSLTVLPKTGVPPVLLVDQCEEAVTLCEDAAERIRFFDFLAAHAEKALLIVALRADRMGELSAHPDFARLVERGLYLLKGMDEQHLRAAIELPARQAGLMLEPGLVDLLIRDVEGEPGSLPLLSHALRQTWERREGNSLTVAGYQASGGIRGAVAQSAEQVYERAPEEQRPILRDLMLRLVAPSPDGEPVRSRVPRRVVAADTQHEEIIELLVDARLVTSDEDVVELAHEAIARAWPRLRGWLDDDVEGQRIWRHLAIGADSWDGLGRPDSELYRGVRLAQASEWRQRTGPDLNQVERDFIDTSESLANAETRAAKEEAIRQLRINRRLRVLVAGVAVLMVVAGIGVVTAIRQADRADAEAALARSHELSASAVGAIEEDPALAKLLAVASAASGEPNLQSISALHQTLASDLAVARYGVNFDVGMVWTDVHPSGDRIVASGAFPHDGSGWMLEVVDPYTDERLWAVDLAADPAHASAFVGSPLFSADGERLIAGVFWDPFNLRRAPVPFDGVDEPAPDTVGVHIRDADTGDLIDRIDVGRCGGFVGAMSSTHLLVRTLHGPAEVVEACRWSDGEIGVELVTLESGERRLLSSETNTPWSGAALSGDGRYAAYDEAASGQVVVIDAASGDEVLRKEGWGVRDLNHDGSLLILGNDPIEVWDVVDGTVTSSFDGHGGFSMFAGFGPSGQTVLSTGADGALREWDATTGEEVFAYPGIGNGRPSYTDDGLILVGQPDRSTATLIDTGLRGEVGAIETCAGSPLDDTLTVIDGVATLAMSCEGDPTATIYVVDLASSEILQADASHSTSALAVSPDGTRLVRQEGDGTTYGALLVRDTATGDRLLELEGLCSWDAELPVPIEDRDGCSAFPERPFGISASRLRWSPDGTKIAAAFAEGLAVWDARDGSMLFTDGVRAGQQFTVDVLFTPDSTRLLATSDAWKIKSLSTETGETLGERELFVDGGYQLGLVGFTPDGSTLLAAGAFQGSTAGALHWFDVGTLEWIRSKSNVHEGSVRSVAMHPDRTEVATASSDGQVRLWDVASGDLIHEVPFGDKQVRGVAFVNEHDIAVTLEGGKVVIVTTDVEELLELGRVSLTRGFTLTECSRFNFGDHCPTLAELAGSRPATPSILDGTFRLAWTAEDLEAVMMDEGRRYMGGDPDPRSLPFIADLSEDLAATYVMTLTNGRFDIIRDDETEPFCTGTYTVSGHRAWMRSERGRWCVEIKFFDAAFELTDDHLQFDREDFRGEWPNKMVFATRPFERVD